MLSPLSRVLVVEDTEEDAYILCHLLEKAGLKITPQVLGSTESAVEYLAGADVHPNGFGLPSLVFIDVWLPGLSGFELLKWVRQQRSLEALTVVLLTASDEPRDIGKALRLGADAYFVKFPPPSAIREMLAEVEKATGADHRRTMLPISSNLLLAVAKG